MRQVEQGMALHTNEQRRAQTVVETLAGLESGAENLAAVAHDARNVVSALGLYGDLLDQPGVLTPEFTHYADELRLLAAASRRLVEKLVALDMRPAPLPAEPARFERGPNPHTQSWARRRIEQQSGNSTERQPGHLPEHDIRGQISGWDLLPSPPVADLAAELEATRNLLAALAGPSIALTVEAEGGALPVRINGEDLTRVLVNLIKNCAEAMPSGGHIRISLGERAAADARGIAASNKIAGASITGAADACGSRARLLRLAIEDDGPGIAAEALEKVFESGYSRHASSNAARGSGSHRGLGLAIARSLVEQAGGRIHAETSAMGGARIVIELPADLDRDRNHARPSALDSGGIEVGPAGLSGWLREPLRNTEKR